MKLPKFSILLIPALALLAWFFWRTRALDSRLATQAPTEYEPHGVPQAQAPTTAAPQPNLLETRRQHNLLIAHKIRPIPISGQGAGQQLSVTIDPHAVWCKAGDLDTIKAVTQSYAQAEYALTLEGLGSDKTIQSARLSLKDLFDGKSFRINLPAFKGTQLLAVSLCRASGQARCLKQKSWNPAASLKSLEKSAGLLFYTQILLRKPEGIFLIPSDRWDAVAMKQVLESFPDLDRNAQAELKSSFERIQQIKPLPATLSSQGLMLPLTYNDPRCLQRPR